MKIDEPETPWASPPKELFEDPSDEGGDAAGGPAAGVAMDDVAERLREIEARGRGDISAGGGGGGGGDEWESSDDEGDEKRRAVRPKLSFPDPEGSGGGGGEAGGEGASSSAEGGDGEENDDEGPLDEMDKVLKARLFEAQRKSHQCTFRGIMAKGRALLEQDEDEDE